MIGAFIKSSFSGYLAIACVLGLIGAVIYIRNLGYQDCLKDQIVQTNTQNEKRNEILNNRPDTARFLDELYSAADW